MKKIVITGPESTGKTTLTRELSRYYNCPMVTEYARCYVEKLDRPYYYNDVENMAIRHVEMTKDCSNDKSEYLFIDTYLIIFKIWFIELYKKYPDWLDMEIEKKEIDLYLFCDTDIPWVPDPVRENGGIQREYLKERYREELEKFHMPYKIINGIGKKRLNLAIEAINNHFITGN